MTDNMVKLARTKIAEWLSEDVQKFVLYSCAAVGAYKIARMKLDFLYGVWKHLLRPRHNLMKRYCNNFATPWAVITGGAGGIGLAYAQELAAAGFNICVIDKDSKGLAAMKSSLKVKVETILFDFCELGTEAGHKKLENLLKSSLAGKDVAVLVNNVAEFQHQKLTDSMWSYCLRATNVNCHSYAAMAKYIIPGMLERQTKYGVRSAIINVGTCAAEPQNPRFQFSIYGATKAYTHILSSSLNEMYSDKIDVMSVIPRQTETEMNPAGYMYTATPKGHAKAVFDQLGYESITYGPMMHCLEYNLRFKYTVFGLFDKYVQWCNSSRNKNLIKLYDQK